MKIDGAMGSLKFAIADIIDLLIAQFRDGTHKWRKDRVTGGLESFVMYHKPALHNVCIIVA